MTKLNHNRNPSDPDRKSESGAISPSVGPAWSPASMGRSTAIIHGEPCWQPTVEFASTQLSMLDRAFARLDLFRPDDFDSAKVQLLKNHLQEARAVLNHSLPAQLPFLSPSTQLRLRLRIAAIIREWSLTSRPPRHPDHLKAFLHAYQDLFPLCSVEINLIPTVLRLTIGEKCRILPTPEESGHQTLIPRLMEDLVTACQLIAGCNWETFGKETNLNHSARSPAKTIAGGRGKRTSPRTIDSMLAARRFT